MRLARARARAATYLDRHGARVTIQRKTGETWTERDTDVPCMIEYTPGGGAIGVDPVETLRDGIQTYRLSFAPGQPVEAGDRVLVETGGGPTDPLTVQGVNDTSLDVYRQATAVIERLAVETYPVTIERYDDDTGAYVEVFSGQAQLTGGDPTEGRPTQGAAGDRISGLVVFDPVPNAAIGVGDWIAGIPWAPGATVTRVRPVVGTRLELEYEATT